ncbi:MAG: HAMP domain-containing sensor histidine kinase [Oscillospiraceae bacterium]
MPEHEKKAPGKLRSSLVTRLNTRLFFRLLGIYLGMNLLLLSLCGVGTFIWAENQCAQVADLVETRGVPSAEATAWMAAGDYTVTALDRAPRGTNFGGFFALPDATQTGLRTVTWTDHPAIFTLWRGHPGRGAAYRIELVSGDTPYAITLDLEKPVSAMIVAARILLLCQLLSLVMNLFKNGDTIRKVLKPIQDLTAAATKLGDVSGMSPEELRLLSRQLGSINAKHLDTRLAVDSTQQELRDLAGAINAMLDRINAAYRAQMRFVSDASHELRTPIAVIQGYASLLNRWGKDDKETMQEAIDAIGSEADSMKQLVEQLLFLARGDNDSMKIELCDCDLTELAAEVLKETAMIDRTHPLKADWEEAVIAHADPALMKQVMRILVDNACKYTPEGGQIVLAVHKTETEVRLSVQDEGQGIPQEALDHIFDRFYRTDQSRARQTGGAGLGLSIARWVVERHGGWFEVTSREHIGTKMTIVLPQITH